MGLLDLMRHMSIQRQRHQKRHRWRQAQNPRAHDGPIATSRANKRKGSPCQRDDSGTQGGRMVDMYSGPSLPEDVWCHIHSLMPMRDAARAACVSRAFLHSWRRHPELIFDTKTLGLDENACENNGIARDFSGKVDQVLKKHSGINVKRLKIWLTDYSEDSCHLNHWLQIAVTPGIEELALSLPLESKYNFPYSLLCNGRGDSIRSFHLACCSFSPTAELGWLRRLTRLHLYDVCIAKDKLEHLLSNSFALEHLNISWCGGIVPLKVPCLQRLSYLEVISCQRLRTISVEAPNISTFHISGDPVVRISLWGNLQIKDLLLFSCCAVHYACVELLSNMPNLETLALYSYGEVAIHQCCIANFSTSRS